MIMKVLATLIKKKKKKKKKKISGLLIQQNFEKKTMFTENGQKKASKVFKDKKI